MPPDCDLILFFELLQTQMSLKLIKDLSMYLSIYMSLLL